MQIKVKSKKLKQRYKRIQEIEVYMWSSSTGISMTATEQLNFDV